MERVEVIGSDKNTFEIKLTLKADAMHRFNQNARSYSRHGNKIRMAFEIDKQPISAQTLELLNASSLTTKAKLSREQAESFADSIRNAMSSVVAESKKIRN